MRISSPRRAPGFTFVETLVCILALALVLAAVAPLARGAVRALGTVARESSRLHDIARAYALFRTSCEDTCVPPWVAGTDAAAQVPGGFRVAYLGGDEDESWKLSAEGDGLVVEAPGGKRGIQASRARVERIVAGGRAVGIEASFESMGRAWAWKGYFGAAGY
jgi:hypothetical protein